MIWVLSQLRIRHMLIKGKKVVIRAIENSDAEILQAAINDPILEGFEVGFAFPVSYDQQLEWIQKNQRQENGIKLVIEYADEVVGYTNILNIDWKNRTAWNGIKLFSEKYRGKGLATDTVFAIMRYCFEELNLNRLEGAILTFNKPSYHLYVEKCGWSVEGTKRQNVYKKGKYHDQLMVAILKEDYEKLIEKTNYWNETK